MLLRAPSPLLSFLYDEGSDMRWLSSFNKRREDFPDLKSYNDYLEEVEDISRAILAIFSFNVI